MVKCYIYTNEDACLFHSNCGWCINTTIKQVMSMCGNYNKNVVMLFNDFTPDVQCFNYTLSKKQDSGHCGDGSLWLFAIPVCLFVLFIFVTMWILAPFCCRRFARRNKYTEINSSNNEDLELVTLE